MVTTAFRSTLPLASQGFRTVSTRRSPRNRLSRRPFTNWPALKREPTGKSRSGLLATRSPPVFTCDSPPSFSRSLRPAWHHLPPIMVDVVPIATVVWGQPHVPRTAPNPARCILPRKVRRDKPWRLRVDHAQGIAPNIFNQPPPASHKSQRPANLRCAKHTPSCCTTIDVVGALVQKSNSPYWERPQFTTLKNGKWDIIIIMLGTFAEFPAVNNAQTRSAFRRFTDLCDARTRH